MSCQRRELRLQQVLPGEQETNSSVNVYYCEIICMNRFLPEGFFFFFFVAWCLCFIIRDGFHTQVWFAQTQLVCRSLRAGHSVSALCIDTLLQSNCFHLPTTSDVVLHVFDKIPAQLLVCFCCVVSVLSFTVEIVAGLGTFQSSTGPLFKKLSLSLSLERWNEADK